MAERLTEGRPRRFLPSDPRVEEPYRLTPQLALRVAVLGFIALAVFAVLFLRLWALQVLSGDKYRAQANDNRVAPPDRRAARLDRRPVGQRHRANVLGTSLEIWPSDLPKGARERSKELATLADRRRQAGRDPGEAHRRPERSAHAGRHPPRHPPTTRSRISRSTSSSSRASSSPTRTCAATRTSRSPPSCSDTSGRSPPRS